MGMFDWYQPKPPIPCPLCGKKLKQWQGKNGPNLLLRWRQGIAVPSGGLVRGLSKAEREEYGLPKEFEIRSYDCPTHQPITVFCKTSIGVWKSVKVMGHGRFDTDKGKWKWVPYSI